MAFWLCSLGLKERLITWPHSKDWSGCDYACTNFWIWIQKKNSWHLCVMNFIIVNLSSWKMLCLFTKWIHVQSLYCYCACSDQVETYHSYTSVNLCECLFEWENSFNNEDELDMIWEILEEMEVHVESTFDRVEISWWNSCRGIE